MSTLQPDQKPSKKRKSHGEDGKHQDPLPVPVDPATVSKCGLKGQNDEMYHDLLDEDEEAEEPLVPAPVAVGVEVLVTVTTVTVAPSVAAAVASGSIP
jgi:hypothetical protein